MVTDEYITVYCNNILSNQQYLKANYRFILCHIYVPLSLTVLLSRIVVAGGAAGVTLWTIIFPADVVKSRLQVTASYKILTVKSSSFA